MHIHMCAKSKKYMSRIYFEREMYLVGNIYIYIYIYMV
jgi:hypothetical protein